MNTAEDTVLEFRDTVKTFHRQGHRFHAVDHISWQVHRGEVVAFLGENGAGKSTALNMALGLCAPSAGVVRTLGLAPHKAVRTGKIGAVLQEQSLPGSATVKEVLHMVAATYPRGSIDVAQLCRDWHLSQIQSTRINRCSGGQLQRVRAALAVMNTPELLIMDEPTAGMDVGNRAKFWESMHTRAEGGCSIIFATHYLAEAEEFADRIVVISGGKIVADDTAENLRKLGGHATVSAHFPTAGDAEAAAAAIAHKTLGQPVVEETLLRVDTTDSDALARYLLNETPGYGLGISTERFSDIFTQLTTGDNEADREE